MKDALSTSKKDPFLGTPLYGARLYTPTWGGPDHCILRQVARDVEWVFKYPSGLKASISLSLFLWKSPERVEREICNGGATKAGLPGGKKQAVPHLGISPILQFPRCSSSKCKVSIVCIPLVEADFTSHLTKLKGCWRFSILFLAH